jgi:hypothetical protein
MEMQCHPIIFGNAYYYKALGMTHVSKIDGSNLSHSLTYHNYVDWVLHDGLSQLLNNYMFQWDWIVKKVTLSN